MDPQVTGADPLIVINSVLVAGTHGAAVYRSYDNGESWIRWNSGLEDAHHIWDFVNIGDSLFAATNAGIYLSVNNGKDWLEQNSGLTTRFVQTLAYMDGILFAGTWGGGVFRSEDKGQTWTSANDGLTTDVIKCFAVIDTIIFAGTWWGDGVYRSTDYGKTWNAIYYGIFNSAVNDLIVYNGILFAATHGGVFFSPDYGKYWYQPADGPNGIVNCFQLSGLTFLAGAQSGIHISMDNGNNWAYSNSGLKNSTINALAISDGNLLAGTTGIGLRKSSDNGENWNATSLKSDVYSIVVNDTIILAGSHSTVYSSRDNGENWDRFFIEFTKEQVKCLVVSDTNIFAGTSGDGVLLSTDDAETWMAVNTGLTDSIVYSFALNGTDLYAATENGVFLSRDNGNNWTAIHNGLTGTPAQTLTLCGSDLFAGTANGGVFRLNDEGSSWIEANTGLTEMHIVTLATANANLFAGTLNGVFFSENLGKSWELVNTELRNSVILSLQVSDSNLFAGSRGSGVWKRPLSEMTTDIENLLFSYPNTIALHQNYPNPFNPSTTIKFQIPNSEFTTLKVYNVLGKEVATLVSDKLQAGWHSYQFDGSNLASGVYMYRIVTDNGYSDTKKFVLLK